MNFGQLQTMFVAFAGGFGLIVMSRGFGRAPKWLQSPGGRTFALIAGVLLVLFGLYTGVYGRREDGTYAIVERARAEMKPPRMVDNETRFDNLLALSEEKVGYFYTVTTVNGSQVDDARRKTMEQALRERACLDPSMQKLLERYHIMIVVHANDNVELVRLEMSPGDCTQR
jgi:hypothetical protein